MEHSFLLVQDWQVNGWLITKSFADSKLMATNDGPKDFSRGANYDIVKMVYYE